MEILVVTADEAAKMLRTRPAAIYDRLEAGEIPAYREGSGWKIPRTLLSAYIENRAISEAKERKRVYEEAKMGSKQV